MEHEWVYEWNMNGCINEKNNVRPPKDSLVGEHNFNNVWVYDTYNL